MKFNEALKTVLKKRGYTQLSLAAELGIKQSSIASVLVRNNPRLSIMNNYCNPLGYKVALVPDGTKLSEDCIILENKEQ